MLGIAEFTQIAAGLPGFDLLAWTPGWQEILVIVVVILILFGGRKIPELARGIGRGMREFKREMRGVKEDFDEAIREDEEESAPRRRKKRKKRVVEDDTDSEDDDETEESK